MGTFQWRVRLRRARVLSKICSFTCLYSHRLHCDTERGHGIFRPVKDYDVNLGKCYIL